MMKLLKKLFRRIGYVEERLEMSSELLNKWLDFQFEIDKLLSNKIKEVENKLNEKIDKINKDHMDLVGVTCMVNGSCLELNIQEDYFTKELVKIDATNTRKLYTISWTLIREYYFKEWNQTEEVQKINDCFYLFI